MQILDVESFVTFYIDKFTSRGKGSCKTLLPDLIKNGIDCDLRKLHVGDLLWVAREKVRPLPGNNPSSLIKVGVLG